LRLVAIVSDLPVGLVTRPLERTDLPGVLDVMDAHERLVLEEPMIELGDLEADWQRPSFDPRTDTVGVFDGDRLIAYGEVYQARRAEIYVHPEWFGRGIGTALMRWSWRLVREAGADLVGQTVPDGALDAVDLLRRHGYSPLWTSWMLELPADQPLPRVEVPAGYAIRSFRPGSDEQAAYRVVEDAFNEWPDRDPSSYGDWAAGVLGRPGFEPWQLFLAVRTEAGTASEEVVGVCHLVLSGGSGWVNQLAVAAPHRGKRLAQALLAVAFAAARERGSPRGELSTDSRTGALGLYEHIGMRVTAAFTQWVRRLSPQDDAGERGPDAASVAGSEPAAGLAGG
jgi:GNAT superfamily N-acetyltransferase